MSIVPKIKEFADFPLQVNLAVSLHAPNDNLRSKIMKINKAYNIKEVIDAIDYYSKKTNRRVTIEYLLLKGINDTKECANELVSIIVCWNGCIFCSRRRKYKLTNIIRGINRCFFQL